MKKLAGHHIASETEEKDRKFYMLRIVNQRLSLEDLTTFRRDFNYLKKIDSTKSKRQFLNLFRDSLSERFAFEDVKEIWSSPSDVKSIYLNDLLLASIDSMIEKNVNFTSADILQDSFELVIIEVQLDNDSFRFYTDFFHLIDRDTPYIDPVSGEVIEKDELKVYEARILEY